MNPHIRVRLFAVMGLLPLFAGCGGGASETPTAPSQGPDRPSLPSRNVTIFAQPAPDTYASLGSSTTDAGDGYSPIEPDARLTDVSLEAMYQPVLRYTASGDYEIRLPGAGFDRLVHYAGLANPTSANNFFQPASARQNYATFIVSQSRLIGYRHSELASWTDATAALVRAGSLAFGTPTPSAAIAASGSASYRGQAFGMVDITYVDYLYGGSFFSGAGGMVTLTVDFAARTITGTIEVSADGETTTHIVPLSATIFMSGSDTWLGSFETSESGFNEFKVRLTGPDASELIGSWAVPIVIDGEPHQLMGAWIAARD